MRPNLKIGLVGAGWAARQHCKSLKAIGGADVVAVFDVDPVSRDSLAAELQAVPVRTLDDQSPVHCSARDAAGTVAVALAAAASLDNSGEYQTVPRHPA